MISVLHTIDTKGPGGAETVFINLVNKLDGNIFKSYAAINGPGWLCDTLRKNKKEPIFISSDGRFSFKYLHSMIKIIKQNRIDIVQSHLLGSNLYCSLAGLICRVPVISTFHGYVDAKSNDKLIAIRSRLINIGSRKIVFVSDHLRNYYEKIYGISYKKSLTIYNGVDTSKYSPIKDNSIRKQLGLKKNHILIGALGNIRPAKGYDVFLKAARQVCEENPDCRFIIAGNEGEGILQEKLLKQRTELFLDDKFFFLGFKEDSAKILNNFDLFVLPSISEGFSISTIEAMACGLPVMVTRSGGPEEIVTHGKNGILVNCNSKDIAIAIIDLIKNEELRIKIEEHAFNTAQTKFSLKAMIENYQNIYIKNYR
jgi:glycosyltransferase involved in cell wall biosynthesis